MAGQHDNSLNHDNAERAHPVTLGWVLRRTALGVLILGLGVLAMAILLHSSIEPTLATTNENTSFLDQLTALAGRL